MKQLIEIFSSKTPPQEVILDTLSITSQKIMVE